MAVSQSTMCRALWRVRVEGEKKSLVASERDEAVRVAWRATAVRWCARALVFVDESGTQTKMTPRYSRAPRGQRAVEAAPRNHGKNTTLIADDFTDADAVAAMIRITGGTFRLVRRLCSQIARVLEIKALRMMTADVREAARETLVIGPLT
ncbi:MAG: hypothetical protein ACYDAR_03705 [Thermomicrobiales bacterium]